MRFASVALLLFLQARHLLPIVKMVVFGQATGAIHVSIVDLILPETPCFPFEAFQAKRFLQTLRTNAFLDLSCDSDRMLDLLSSVLKNSQSSWDYQVPGRAPLLWHQCDGCGGRDASRVLPSLCKEVAR